MTGSGHHDDPDEHTHGGPRYALAPGIAWLDGEEIGLTQPIVYVAASTVDAPVILDGPPAWAVWTALAEAGGTLAEVTRAAAELVDADPALIAADVAAFVERLVAAGAVVEEVGSPAPDGTAPFFVEAFGVVVEVLPPDGSTGARWRRQWSRALVAPGTPDATLDAVVTMAEEHESTTDYKMSTRLTQLALDKSSNRLNLHAAGLVDDDGRALALIAASGTGKTTATRELGRLLGYLTDETVSVGPAGDVLPFTKPLSFIDDPLHPHEKSQMGPDELGLRHATVPAHLRRIVLLDRDPEAVDVGLSRLSTVLGISAVLPQTSYVTSLPDPLFRIATLLQATGGAHRLGYAEIADHAEELVAFLASSLDGDGVDVADGPLVHHPGDLPSTGPAGTLARAPWHDAVEVDEAVVVLVDATSYELQGLGATIWLALAQPRTPAELLEIARDEHGSHPDDQRIVDESLASLRELGVIVASESITLPGDHGHGHDHGH